MKVNSLVAGILMMFFGAILFYDAVETTYQPANPLLSTNDVKGIMGFVPIVTAIYYFVEALIPPKQLQA